MAVAISGDRSTLPLSATMTSPSMLLSLNAFMALSMQTARVSASFKHGITIETSGQASLHGSRSSTLCPLTADCPPLIVIGHLHLKLRRSLTDFDPAATIGARSTSDKQRSSRSRQRGAE